jgi:hypothetical protein
LPDFERLPATIRMLLACRRMAVEAWAPAVDGTGMDWKELLSSTTLPLRLLGSGS